MDTPSPSQRRLLEKVFTTALDQGFDPERAETYGVWILCFARYCSAHGIDPPAAAQVPNFMAYLAGRPDLTAQERDRALDAVLFAITEVPDAFASGAPPERTLPAAGPPGEATSPSGFRKGRRSTPGGQALTHLLLHTEIQLYDAVRLRISDVDRDAGVIRVGSDQHRREIPLPDRVRTDVGAAARRALRRGSVYLFPEAHAKYVGEGKADVGDDETAPAGGAEPDASDAPGSARPEPAATEDPGSPNEPSDESGENDSSEATSGDDRVRSIFPNR